MCGVKERNQMSGTVEELTFNYEDNGQLVRKEIKKEILTKGAWATLMFMYQELDRRTGQYREPKISIVRFKKANGVYRKQSSFNISSEKQARQIVEIIERWYGEESANPTAFDSSPEEDPTLEKEEIESEDSAETADIESNITT